MANFTPTTNSVAIPTVIAQQVIKKLPSYMGIARFVSKDVDWTGQDFASYGQTLDIVKPGDLTVQTKTAGTQTTSQAATATKVSVTLNRHKYIELLQEDITKLLQKPDLQAAYADQMAMRLAEDIEAYIYSLHPSITETVTFNTSSEATIEQSFLKLRERFALNKVPLSALKGLFMHPTLMTKILQVSKYTSQDYVQGDVIEMGALRKIYNIGSFESQLVEPSGSPATYHNIATTKEGFVIANRPLPLDGNGKGVRQYNLQDPNTGLTMRVTEGYSQKDLGTIVTMDLVYGAALCDTTQVIEVDHAA